MPYGLLQDMTRSGEYLFKLKIMIFLMSAMSIAMSIYQPKLCIFDELNTKDPMLLLS